MGVVKAENPTRVPQVNQPSHFLSETTAGTEALLLTHGQSIYIAPSLVSLDFRYQEGSQGWGKGINRLCRIQPGALQGDSGRE